MEDGRWKREVRGEKGEGRREKGEGSPSALNNLPRNK